MKTYPYLAALFLILALLNESCGSPSKISNISYDIYNIQKLEFGDNILIQGLSLYRRQFNWDKELKYSQKKDTIFLLELPGIQGDYHYTFWNRVDTISYANNTGTFKLINEPSFTEYMMRLVSMWDIQGIKEAEKNNLNLFPSEIIYATRIIFRNNKYRIDCIRFGDFFNFERDRIK